MFGSCILQFLLLFLLCFVVVSLLRPFYDYDDVVIAPTYCLLISNKNAKMSSRPLIDKWTP
jgi:hypothetical protein